MATLYTHQSRNVRRTWLLMSVFLILIIVLGWCVDLYLGTTGIVYVAITVAVLTNIWSYWKSDSLVLRLTRAEAADPGEYRELHRTVENLAITAGLPKPRVYILNDAAPNAFATGRDPEHGVIAVTTGLLSLLDQNELEGVLAHELSHIGNRDILVGTIAVVLAGCIALVSDLFFRILTHSGGGGRKNGNPAVAIFALVAILLAPIAATLVQLAVSRKREFLADASGALLTRYPEGLARALQKISEQGRPLTHASHATAHLFIADPFGAERGIRASMHRLFATHPPVDERVAALLSGQAHGA